METSALDYNNLPNIPREMRRALFKRYLAKLGGMGIYDLKSLEVVQACANGFQGWLHLPLSLCSQHPQARQIQQEEDYALAAALWFLTRDRRINVRSRIILARWSRMVSGWASCDKKQKKRLHRTMMREREIKIYIRQKKDRDL